MDDEQVADFYLGELAVDGELVVVLAEPSRDVVGARCRLLRFVRAVCLPHHGDVVVRAVHRGTHEVGRAGVDADIVFVDALLVDSARDHAAVRPQHEASHLGVDGDVPHARRHENLLESASHALADGADVVGGLIGPVGDAHAAGEVHEPNVCPRLALQAHGKLEENARERGVVVVRDGVRGEEGVDAEGLGTAFAKHSKCFEKLFLGHAVFRISRVVHDVVGKTEESAGVEPAAHGFGNGARDAFEKRDMADVVIVHDGVELACKAKIRSGRVVRREHDFRAGHIEGTGDHELRRARAVASTAVFP